MIKGKFYGTENVYQRLAILLDNKVISAPQIREPITGGQGNISGNFSPETANDLAVLLRADLRET